MNYYIDLTPFYESTHIKPLLQNAIVESITGYSYRTERWFKGENHAYVFICITKGKNKPPFAQSPSDVEKAIKNNKIIVTKWI